MSVRGVLLLMLLAGGSAPLAAQPLSFESDQPIEITADSLEVVQADRLATFSGNVDAVQGDLVLSADQLLVHYRGSGDDAPDAPRSTSTIRRIEARGNVVVTSPREIAEGEVGVYDVASSLVTLEGSVVLTREDNVIRGDRLELDLTTGVSRVVSTRTAREGAGPGQRVRAVFVPGEGESGAVSDREGASPAPEAGGGQAQPEQADEATGGGRPGAADDGATGGGRPPLPEVKPGAGAGEGG